MTAGIPEKSCHLWNGWPLEGFLQRNGSIVFMLSAQVCSTVLSTTGRLLRMGHGADGTGVIGTSEILLYMMATTTALSWSYIWLAGVPDAPLGKPAVRPLLIVRGVAGYFGIWGFYFSLRYLALAEAIIINFMAPTLAVLLLSLLPGQRSSARQIMAGLISIVGAGCVIQPWNSHPTNSPSEYTIAISAATIGVVGGAVSYATLTRLGDRAHPMLSVAHFGTICTALNGALLTVQRQGFRLPSSKTQWCLICMLGLLGFAMHWLMTASLMWDGNSKRALNFVYTQILFAMVADKIVWQITPDGWKYFGGSLIFGSAMFVASTKMSHSYPVLRDHATKGEEIELS